MNRRLSCIGALFLISFVGVSAAADLEMSSYISSLSLPDGVKMRIGRGGVYSVDYSPDGERIAVGSTIGIWIYDARYGKEIALLRGHTRAVNSADYSPDGKKIVSSSWDGSVRVWDTETGALLNTLGQRGIWTFSAEFSPDGKSLLAAQGGSVKIWDAESNRKGGKLLKTLTGHTDTVFTATYSPDGKKAAGGGRGGDPTVKIWDVETGALLNSIEADENKAGVIAVAFSPDSKRIVSTAFNAQYIGIWDVKTGALLHTLDLLGNFGNFRSFAYSMDGRLLAGGLGRVWSADYASPLQPFVKNSHSSAVSFSPDGHNVAGDVGGGVRIINIQIRAPVYTFGGHGGGYSIPAFSPDGQTIAAPFGGIDLWDYENGAHLKTLGKGSYSGWAAYSPDGKTIAHSDYDEIVIRDVDTDAVLLTLKGHASGVHFGSYSPNGDRIVSASRDKTVRIWDFATGAQHILAGHTERVNCAAFSPDGNAVVSAGGDGTLRIWNAETGALLKALEAHTGRVHSAAYSPDGKSIVSAGGDGTVRIWNAETGARFKTLKVDTSWVYSAAYSPDGKTIACGDYEEIVIWDVETGKRLKTLEGHTDSVRWVGYSPDGKTLGSAGKDGTLLIWDASGEDFRALPQGRE